MSSQSALPATDTATTSVPASASVFAHISRMVKLTMGRGDLTVLDQAHGPKPVVIKVKDQYFCEPHLTSVGKVTCKHGIDEADGAAGEAVGVGNCRFRAQGREPGHYLGAGTIAMATAAGHRAYVVSPGLAYSLYWMYDRAFDQVVVAYDGRQFYLEAESSLPFEHALFTVKRDGNVVEVKFK